MKFTCNRHKLSDAVSNVQRAVAPKTVKPILEGILIKAENGTITLTGYNTEMCMQTTMDARIEKEGSSVITAKLFSEIIRKMPEDSITIEVDEKNIVYITSGKSNYKITGMPAEDYPELPVIRSRDIIKMDAQILSSMIRQTIYAISENDAKPAYTGSLFEIEEGNMRIVSVDGIRLAIRTEKIDYDGEKSFIVPGRSLQEVLRLITPDTETAEIATAGRHIIFRMGEYSLISKLLETEFISYRSAIPTTHTTELTVNTRKFISTVERMSLLLTDKMKSPIRCYIDENLITTTCNTMYGQGREEIEVEMQGESVEIGFNNRYLLDALKNSDTDEVKIYLSGSVKPMVIKPTEGDSFLFILVPMRLAR